MNPVLVAVIERLMDDVGDKIAVDVPMGALTTYRVGGRAAAMVVVDDHETLSAVAAAVAGTGIPVMTLGRGSNMLVADRGFDGLVVHMAGDYAAINVVDETIVIAGGRRNCRSLLERRSGTASLASSGRSVCRVRSAAQFG